MSGMFRKVVEEFCQWLVTAKKESEARIVDDVDWDQVDGLRQKLSTMKSKQRDVEPTTLNYMTDVHRQNTALSDHLTIGGRMRAAGNQPSQPLFPASQQQQIHASLYSGSTPVADDDWSLSQRRSYSAPIYEEPAPPAFAPDTAAVDETFFSYATESPVAAARRAQNAASDESYEPLMIGGMDYSIAPQSTELDQASPDLPPVPLQTFEAPQPVFEPDSAVPLAMVSDPQAGIPLYAVPRRPPAQLPFAVAPQQQPSLAPQPQVSFAPQPDQSFDFGPQPQTNFAPFNAGPGNDPFPDNQRKAPLQIQNLVLRRDPQPGQTAATAIDAFTANLESSVAIQRTTQDLTELVPIKYQPNEELAASPEPEIKLVAHPFSGGVAKTLIDVPFGTNA